MNFIENSSELSSQIKYYIVFFSGCWCLYINANSLDSMYQRALFYEKLNADSAILYFNKIINNISYSKTNTEQYAKSLRKKALLQSNINDEKENIALCQKAIPFFQQLNNKKEIGITYNTIANIYQVKGYYDLSVRNYQKAASIFDTIHFYNGLMICYSNIASIYNTTEQYNNALQYNILAYRTAQLEKDSFSIGMIAQDVSISYAKIQEPDSAKYYAETAIKYGTLLQNNFILAYANKALYEYDKSNNNWSKALTSAQTSLRFSLQTPSKYDIVFAYCNLAEAYHNLRRNALALQAIQNAEMLAKQMASFQLNKRVYELYKKIMASTGNYKAAYYYAQQYQQNSDSVFFEKRNNTLNELETKYQTVQKESEIANQKIIIQQQQLKNKQVRTRLFIVLVLFLALFVGLIVLYLFFKQRQKLLQEKIITIEQQKKLELTQAIMDGEEQERIRLARELHDGIGGLMSMLKLQFSNITKTNPTLIDNGDYNNTVDLLNTTSQDIRKISHALMPSALERLGLNAALEQFCTQLQQTGNIEIDFQYYNLKTRLPQRMELLCYRIVQELLNNIIKHARAKEVIVQISRNEHIISITVEDDGIGFNVSTIKTKNGIGLNSMQQRVELLGGTMDIDSTIGKGTAIYIEIQIK